MKREDGALALAVSPNPTKGGRAQAAAAKGKIWIDLDNSPNVPFFGPIVEELERRGYSVVLTVRDCFQVRELADLWRLNYTVIGRHSGKNKVRKLVGLCFRALEFSGQVVVGREGSGKTHDSPGSGNLLNLIASPSRRYICVFC